jgi:hypothetical protein
VMKIQKKLSEASPLFYYLKYNRKKKQKRKIYQIII